MSGTVRIVEVGLRDGLQNESVLFSASEKISIGEGLVKAGLKFIEVGAFVRSDKVPQMKDSSEVVLGLSNQGSKKIQMTVLVPNEKGMLEALKTPIQEIALFGSCSESFSQKNINCSIEESFQRFTPVIKLAKEKKIKIRGYLSVCFGCPYEGVIPESRVLKLAHRLMLAGCHEISIGDTIGVASPKQVESMIKRLKVKIPLKKIAGHFHDTRGLALANILTSYKLGVRIFDASIGGLGGCPYAPGASGNVATEDVVYLFDKLGVKTGVDLKSLVEISKTIQQKLGRPLPSRVFQSLSQNKSVI